jgi:guanyl-specific ribonuclease Sa
VRRVRRPLLALIALVVALGVGYAIKAGGSGHDSPHLRMVALSSLPREVAATIKLIEHGGPLPYPAHDGAVFHNNERHLPKEPDGYYREYTVPTPGLLDTRGPRRLILARDGTFYYTADHYRTFVVVDLRR